MRHESCHEVGSMSNQVSVPVPVFDYRCVSHLRRTRVDRIRRPKAMTARRLTGSPCAPNARRCQQLIRFSGEGLDSAQAMSPIAQAGDKPRRDVAADTGPLRPVSAGESARRHGVVERIAGQPTVRTMSKACKTTGLAPRSLPTCGNPNWLAARGNRARQVTTVSVAPCPAHGGIAY